MTGSDEKQSTLPGVEGVRPGETGTLDGRFADLTTREVAHIFDVSKQALDGWRAAGCPVEKYDGRLHWDLPLVVQWRRQRDREKNSGTVAADPDGTTEQQMEYYKLKEQRLKVQRMEGKLVKISDVKRELRQVFQALNREIETLEQSYPQAAEEIRDCVDRARQRAEDQIEPDEETQ